MRYVGIAPPPVRTPTTRRAFTLADVWKIVGIAVVGVVGIWFIARIIDVLLVFFAAIIFAEAIRPLVVWGMRHLHLPRWAATILVYLGVFVILAALISIVVAPLVTQIQNLNTNLPDRINRLQHEVAVLRHSSPAWDAVFSALEPQTQAFGTTILNALLAVPSAAFSVLFNVAFTLFLAFYWLNATDGLRNFVISLFPSRTHKLLHAMGDEMGQQLGGYVRSVIINMVAIGAITSIALSLQNSP